MMFSFAPAGHIVFPSHLRAGEVERLVECLEYLGPDEPEHRAVHASDRQPDHRVFSHQYQQFEVRMVHQRTRASTDHIAALDEVSQGGAEPSQIVDVDEWGGK